MPTRAAKHCHVPGCGGRADATGCCERHPREPWKRRPDERKQSDQRRGTSGQRGYDSRWQKARRTYLSHHPLCVECEALGRVAAATVVHHVVAHRGDQRLFWDVGNWAALCRMHHDRHTAAGE